jgi:hypothetical protein
LGSSSTKRWLGSAFVTICVLLWLTPVGFNLINFTIERTLPDTRAALSTWAAQTIPDGAVIVDFDSHRVFSKDWGNYQGPYRVWLKSSITDYSLDQWRELQANYVAVSDFTVEKWKSAQQVDRNYLQNMLFLKKLPDDNRSWRGPTFHIYRTSRPQVVLKAVFGEQLALVGYNVAGASSDAMSIYNALPGQPLSLTFFWQALRQPTANYSVYIHLVPTTDRIPVAQADGALAAFDRPTITWSDTAETLMSSPFTITIPAEVPQGDYRVLVGVYDYATGTRLITEPQQDYLQLFEVKIANKQIGLTEQQITIR